MHNETPPNGTERLRAERRAFTQRVLQVAAGILAVLGPVFAVSESSEQTLAHNIVLLLLVPVGLGTVALVRSGRQQAGVFLLLLGITPVIAWIHLFGKRADSAIYYLAPVLVMAMITSTRRAVRWIPVGILGAGLVIRSVRWWLQVDTDFGRWLTGSFDVLAALAIVGLLLWMGLARSRRDEVILRAALEDRERLAELARIANDEKSSFLARVSHELRTPLNAIVGYSELLEEEEAVRPDNVQDLERIQEAARQLLGLIDSVLDLSKVEAGRLELNLEVVQLSSLIDRVEGMVAPLLRRNGNAIVVDHQGPSAARLDGPRVSQILLNLLSNAARFTHDGRVTLSVRSEPGVVIFEVSDTGIGIPADRLGVLFQPFVQASALTARDYGGTGLGLALCERFTRTMGGHIEVESVVGEGSTFRVTLPDGS